jgi:hypothetical protein
MWEAMRKLGEAGPDARAHEITCLGNDRTDPFQTVDILLAVDRH